MKKTFILFVLLVGFLTVSADVDASKGKGCNFKVKKNYTCKQFYQQRKKKSRSFIRKCGYTQVNLYKAKISAAKKDWASFLKPCKKRKSRKKKGCNFKVKKNYTCKQFYKQRKRKSRSFLRKCGRTQVRMYKAKISAAKKDWSAFLRPCKKSKRRTKPNCKKLYSALGESIGGTNSNWDFKKCQGIQKRFNRYCGRKFDLKGKNKCLSISCQTKKNRMSAPASLKKSCDDLANKRYQAVKSKDWGSCQKYEKQYRSKCKKVSCVGKQYNCKNTKRDLNKWDKRSKTPCGKLYGEFMGAGYNKEFKKCHRLMSKFQARCKDFIKEMAKDNHEKTPQTSVKKHIKQLASFCHQVEKNASKK